LAGRGEQRPEPRPHRIRQCATLRHPCPPSLPNHAMGKAKRCHYHSSDTP
jgi:hypothetical protein